MLRQPRGVENRKLETPEEVQASRAKMNEDRNPQIDAAIVRVMKAKREATQERLERENGGQPVQVCLECNLEKATGKSLASAFRPVCDSCNKKLKVEENKLHVFR